MSTVASGVLGKLDRINTHNIKETRNMSQDTTETPDLRSRTVQMSREEALEWLTVTLHNHALDVYTQLLNNSFPRELAQVMVQEGSARDFGALVALGATPEELVAIVDRQHENMLATLSDSED